MNILKRIVRIVTILYEWSFMFTNRVEALFKSKRTFPMLNVYHTEVDVKGMRTMGPGDGHYSIHNRGGPITVSCYDRIIHMTKNAIHVDDKIIPINMRNTYFCIRYGVLCTTSLHSGPEVMEDDSQWNILMILKRPTSIYNRILTSYTDIMLCYN